MPYGGGDFRNKRSVILKLVLCALLFLPICTKAQVSKSYSGTGTEEDPYVITAPQQLADFSTNFNAGKDLEGDTIYPYCYVRIDAASLDMEGISMQPIGNSYITATNGRSFYGVFDGNQCVIYNLTISTTRNYSGLFGAVGINSNAQTTDPRCYIRNIIIEDCSFSSTKSASRSLPSVGGICGVILSKVTIENCIVKNTTISSTSCAGGIAGSVTSGAYNSGTNSSLAIINACGSYGNTIKGYNGGDVDSESGNQYYGGASHIAGPCRMAVFTNNTYSENSITAKCTTATVNDSTYNFFVINKYLYNSEHWGDIINNSEGNEPVVVTPYMLIVNDWNLVGATKDGRAFDMLMNNSEGNDVAAKEWTEDGVWSSYYKIWWNKMTRGVGYFAYVYDVAEDGTELSNKVTSLSQTEEGTFEPLTLTNNNSGKKFYMLSNPYGATKTFADFSFTGLQNDNGYYKYRAAYSAHDAAELAGFWEFVTDTKTKIVGGEGFAVEGSSNTLTFNGISAKKSLKGETALPMTLKVKSNGLVTRKAYAKISEDAQNGYDNHDSHILFSTNRTDIVEPYFLIGEENIIYNTFASLPYQVPVSFRSGKTNNAVLSVTDIPEGLTVSIVDVQSGEETILNDQDFEFTALEGDNSGRYELKIFKSASSLTDVQNVNVSVWNTGKEINVSGDNLRKVQVLNTLGQVVFSSSVSANNYHFTLNANAGAYLVKTYTDNGQTVNKIVVE